MRQISRIFLLHNMNFLTILLVMAGFLILILVACDSGPTTSGATKNTLNTGTSADDGGKFIVSNTGDAPVCTVTPRGRGLDILAIPSSSSEVIGTLPSGNWVQVSVQTEDGWYQIHDPATPIDDAWIIGRGVILMQPCACGPECMRYDIPAGAPEITDCEVGFIEGDFVTIYFLPDEDSNVFGVSTAGDAAAGAAQAITADNWIGYDPGIRTNEEGAARLRWLQVDDPSVLLNGTQCVDLPMYSFTWVEK